MVPESTLAPSNSRAMRQRRHSRFATRSGHARNSTWPRFASSAMAMALAILTRKS